MTLSQLYDTIAALYASNTSYLFGLRYEDKDREIGEEIDWSRHNPDREDERDFPDFNDPGYEDLPLLNGTSVWYFEPDSKRRVIPGYGTLHDCDADRIASHCFYGAHCYVVVGEDKGRHDDPDDGEMLIRDAVVAVKLF